MGHWLPDVITPASGKEFARISFMSPFMRLSVFAEDDPKIVDKHYGQKEKLTIESTKLVNMQLQSRLECIRNELYNVFHQILKNPSSRESAMNYLSQALVRNEKRSQMQVSERLVSDDGFMLNLLSVLQKLSSKIDVGKIDLYYPFHPNSRMCIKKDETRLKMNTADAEEWLSKLSATHDWQEPKFTTECFFMALDCHHLSVIPCIRKYTSRIRAIREYQRIADEMTATQPVWSQHPGHAQRNPILIKRWREQARRLAKAKTCADAGLLDHKLLGNTLDFYNMVMSLLLRSVSDSDPVTLPLTSEVPKIFAAYPEWYIEDMADFLLFTVQYAPQVVETSAADHLIQFIIAFVCSATYVSNPYLVAKMIEVMFVSSSAVNNYTGAFNQRILSHPLAQQHLARALMKFYTDVESTGSSSEFYDKFTIRYHISVILKSMWSDHIHQKQIIEESRNGSQFVRFCNMLMNDTTFLLDESLESLKRIHEMQEAQENKAEWDKQTREQQETRQRQLASDERQCRSYLTLASETVDMFHYLTDKIVEPFLRPVSF